MAGIASRTGLLDLPIKLRTHIYEYFLDDLLHPPWHPHDLMPDNAQWQGYLNLLRACRQVDLDCGDLFKKQYSNKPTFYFEYAMDLIDFKEKILPKHPILANAKFQVISLNQDDDNSRFPVNETAEMIHNPDSTKFGYTVLAIMSLVLDTSGVHSGVSFGVSRATTLCALRIMRRRVYHIRSSSSLQWRMDAH